MPEDKEIDDDDLLKWAKAKMQDDFQLAVRKLSDTPSTGDDTFSDHGKLRFDALRKLTPPGRDPKIPEEVDIYPDYDEVPEFKELPQLGAEILEGRFTVWSECTQVGALWTLLEINKLVKEELDRRLDIDHHFTTGHELVNVLSSTGPQDQPQFAVITCAPVHLYRVPLPYRFMNPIHLEKQFFLQKGNNAPDQPGRVFQLFFSTAEAYLQDPSVENDLQFRDGFTTVNCHTFENLVQSAQRKMNDGDYLIAWRPLSDGMVYKYKLNKHQLPYCSPIALYRRTELSDEVANQFTQLFFSTWESCRRQNKADPDKAFKKFTSLLDEQGWQRNFLAYFRWAAGLTTTPAENKSPYAWKCEPGASFWTIRFAGQERKVKANQGVKIIHKLLLRLQEQGRPYSALELYHVINPPPREEAGMNSDELDGAADGDPAVGVPTRNMNMAIARIEEQLKNEGEDSDAYRQLVKQKYELEERLKQLNHTQLSAEKARKAQSMAISRFKKMLCMAQPGSPAMTDLANYLARYIKITQAECYCIQNDTVDWEL